MKETNRLRTVMESIDTLSKNVKESSTEEFQAQMKAYHASKGGNRETHDPNWPDVNFDSVEIENVDRRDHPDYVDAYAVYAEFKDGTALSDEELNQFTDDRSDVIQEKAYEIGTSE